MSNELEKEDWTLTQLQYSHEHCREPAPTNHAASTRWDESENDALVEACDQGWLDLPRAYQATWNWDGPDRPLFDPDNQTSASLLLLIAISLKQLPTVAYLLTSALIIPSLRFAVPAALKSPNLQIFKLMLAYDPNIIKYDFNQEWSASLSCACYCTDPSIAMCLLDNGADPRQDYRFDSPLANALQQNHPLKLIRRLIERGAPVRRRYVIDAKKSKRLALLVVFLFTRPRVSLLDRATQEVSYAERKQGCALTEDAERRWWRFWASEGRYKGPSNITSYRESKLGDWESI